MNTFYRHILLLIALTFSVLGMAQQQNRPLNREFGLVNQKVFDGFETNIHSSFSPINQSFFKNVSDSTLSKSEKKYYLINISKSEKKPRNFFGWMWRSFAYENFLVVDTGNFYLTVDPLFNIESGKDSEATSDELSKNTRGIIVRANVGEKFSFETTLYENQMFLPAYQADYVNSTGVVPGQGRVKAFKSNGYDFSSTSANISYTPTDYINFQLGTGKNFVGNGYRSLLLSDASFNYPFWKIITTFGKKDQFQYTKLNASLSSITRREDGSTPEALFQRKTMSTHYFSWLATKWLNIGLFESTLWETEDSSGTKPLQWQQFNPIIGVNTATTGFNDVNHTVVGTNLKIKLPFKAILYNQFVYDGSSRYGYQIGARYFGINNLTLQVEYNNVEPNTYSSDTPLQTYSNYNESLAHPLGNNFKEAIGIINYKLNRFFTQVKVSSANITLIETAPEFNFIGQQIGVITKEVSRDIQIIQFHMGFVINPKNNMSIIVGVTQRTQEDSDRLAVNKTDYFYFGVRTNLRNLYDDF